MARDGRHDGSVPQGPFGRDPWSRDDAPEWRSELPENNPKNSANHECADYTRFGFKELGSSDVINAYLDGELSRRSPRFRASLVSSKKFREELAAMEELDAELGRHPRGPDFSGSIMDRLEGSAKFAGAPRRRIITVWRLAAAASVLLALSATVLVARTMPTAFPGSPSPLAAVVNGRPVDASEPSTKVKIANAEFSKDSRVASANSRQTDNPSLPIVRGVLTQIGHTVRGNGTFEIRPAGGTMLCATWPEGQPHILASLPVVTSPERLWADPDGRAWRDAEAVAEIRTARLPRWTDGSKQPAAWASDLRNAPLWRLVPVDVDAAYAKPGVPAGADR